MRIKAKSPQPKRKDRESGDDAATEADARRSAAGERWDEQEAVLGKLHTIVEDARTYEQDTGVHVLNIGFPLLSLPPGSLQRHGRISKPPDLSADRVHPVTLTLKRGSSRSVEIACHGEGIDRVTPNTALLSWLQQQTGQTNGHEDLFVDEDGKDPWREISGAVRRVCGMIEMETPAMFAEGARTPVGGKGSTETPADDGDDDDARTLSSTAAGRTQAVGCRKKTRQSSSSSDLSPPVLGGAVG